MLVDPRQQLEEWLQGREDEHLECKEARGQYSFEHVLRYCVALANEGGGHLVLGVTDQRPRRVVGTRAFTELERTKGDLFAQLHMRINAYEVSHPDGRVVIFEVPSRPFGGTAHYKGVRLMRAGEDLVPMSDDVLKKILDEAVPDFSAEVCAAASLGDLDPAAVQQFRNLWRRHANNPRLDTLSDEQLLADAELVVGHGVTYAALILLGTRQALGMHLAQAEVVFEYRSSEASGPAQQRKEFREGFFLFHDALWDAINLRNDRQHFQDGFFVLDVPTFNERAIREAIANAVSHRDYRLPGSTFVRQYPRKLRVESPGGFPPGVTVANILDKQVPRNRRIAETLARCHVVERSGQGVNLMFEECIKESKPHPDFTGTDDYQVSVTLNGQVQDVRFLRFLEKVGSQTVESFTTQDLLILDLVHREQDVPADLRGRLQFLGDMGVIEPIRGGKRGRYTLSRRFYGFLGQRGTYTRRQGLDRETNKELLAKHLRDSYMTAPQDGCRLAELAQVLPSHSTKQVQSLLRELEQEHRITHTGKTKGARWFWVPEHPSTSS